MKVKNISPRDEVVVLRENGNRVVHTVAPEEILELPDSLGINLCKAEGSRFVPEGKESDKILADTKPPIESVKVARKRAGSEKQAQKDIKKGKNAEEVN